MKRLSKTDKYGVKEYHILAKLTIVFGTLYAYIALMSYPLLIVEQDVGNIKNYGDAFWVLQMSASTIGFGDLYPVTTTGRWIVALSFYVGVGLAGYAGGTIATFFTGFTDTAVQNRELRQQNEEIIKLIKENKDDKIN